MHGYIIYELKKYITERFGEEVWKKINTKENYKYNLIVATKPYPDTDVFNIVNDALEITGEKPNNFLQDFGYYISPVLITNYKAFIKPDWKTIDLLENTENTIHTVVRRDISGTPPRLETRREGNNRIEITYRSARKMCAFAKGIIYGIANHYHEKVLIKEKSCMNKGDEYCLLSIEVQK